MKKCLFIIVAACVLLTPLTGCSDTVNLNKRNGYGSPSVNIKMTETAATVATTALAETEQSALLEQDAAQPPQPKPTHLTNVTEDVDADGVIEIREKMFVAQTNEIFYNAEKYLGKTIKYEGIFTVYNDEETGKTYHSVIRYGPGCCGVDANCGFEVTWGTDAEYPKQDDWVEAEGVLTSYSEDGFNYLQLNLTSLNILNERGAEYVEQ